MKMKFFKLMMTMAVFGMILTGCNSNAAPQSGSANANSDKPLSGTTLNVYNWGDYIDEDVLGTFEEETGIKVTYEYFDSNEAMYTKLKNSGSSYDVVFPSDYFISKMIREDMLHPLNYDNIPNFKHISDRFKDLEFDPDNKYSIPYMWGTLGILYNTTMVDEPIESWNALFDERYAGEIFMYPSQRDAFDPPLILLGYSINTTNIAELEEAKQMLIDQMPLVQAYVGDPVKDKMIGNEGAMALVYSGDAMYCQEFNEDLAYCVPIEGSNVWFDNVVIPKTAKNIEGAEMFIDFLCRPEIAQLNTEYVGYSTTNEGALALLDEDYRNDPIYWPSDEEYERCEVHLDLGDFTPQFDKIWTEVLVLSGSK